MDFSFSDLNLQLDGQLPINFNSVENLPGFEARAAFTVNSAEAIARYLFDNSQIIRKFALWQKYIN